MQSDQELIIMCKPPEPTVIQNKAAGFAGSFPGGARVSGKRDRMKLSSSIYSLDLCLFFKLSRKTLNSSKSNCGQWEFLR